MVTLRESNERYDTVVYVVTAGERGNQRVRSLLKLQDGCRKVVLVSRGSRSEDADWLRIQPFRNPTGFLRLLGMVRTKKKLDRFIYFPSPAVLYAKAVQHRLRKIFRQDIALGKKVILITSVPPHDLCLTGLALKAEFPQIRWIIDWQDLWSFDESYFLRISLRHRSRVLTYERKALSVCDLNVTTNPRAKRVLEEKYSVPAERVLEIQHAYLSQEFASIASTATRVREAGKETIKLGFLGNLFKPPKVPGAELVEAIRRVRQRGVNVELHLYGDTTHAAKKMQQLIQSSNKKSAPYVFFHERTSHEESVRRVAACDYLLLLLSDIPICKAVMHQKLPHYLAIAKPIIAIVPEQSAVADIIRETGSGYVIPVNCNWVDALGAVLQQSNGQESIVQRKREAIERYELGRIIPHWVNAINGHNQ